jgi:hypothetical protein
MTIKPPTETVFRTSASIENGTTVTREFSPNRTVGNAEEQQIRQLPVDAPQESPPSIAPHTTAVHRNIDGRDTETIVQERQVGTDDSPAPIRDGASEALHYTEAEKLTVLSGPTARYSNELMTTGKLSEEAVAEAAREHGGIDPLFVRNFVAGQLALRDARVAAQSAAQAPPPGPHSSEAVEAALAVFDDVAGSRQEWDAFSDWARQNLPEGEVVLIDGTVRLAYRDPHAAREIGQSYFQRYREATRRI